MLPCITTAWVHAARRLVLLHLKLISDIVRFSTSDSTILAFWLVYCISVTSHYTYVWPYMKINAANVALHKFLVGSQVSSTKNRTIKNKFGELQKQRNTRNNVQSRPSNKKKAIKFGMRRFNGTYPLTVFPYWCCQLQRQWYFEQTAKQTEKSNHHSSQKGINLSSKTHCAVPARYPAQVRRKAPKLKF